MREMDCAERTRLLKEHERCAQAYSKALSDLRNGRATSQENEYRQLFSRTEALHRQCGEARSVLDPQRTPVPVTS